MNRLEAALLALKKSPNLCLTESATRAVLNGTADSRHALLKRAVAHGQLIRLRRGLYYPGEPFREYPPNQLEIAQWIYGPSYISLESALAYHQLIPEAVYTVTSVTSKRKKAFDTPLGKFTYHVLPKDDFFIGVALVTENKSQFFLATPWKAICDYVYCYKKEWLGTKPLVKSLRIEKTLLPKPDETFFEKLSDYYKSQRVNNFLQGILKEAL